MISGYSPRLLFLGLIIMGMCHQVSGFPDLATSLSPTDLDAGAFTTWSDDKESTDKLPKNGPRDVIWTKASRPDWAGTYFGDPKTPGPRHLRIGFNAEQTVGTILVRGGGSVSVLKPDAAFPGDLANEELWVPAERILGSEISRKEVTKDEYATWVLPPGTKTRALRFTHIAKPADPKYEGWLGGVLIFPDRLTNVAPQAVAIASTNDEATSKLNNSRDDSWKSWDNGKEGSSHPISSTNSEWVKLIWPRPISLTSLVLCTTGVSTGEIEVFAGPHDRHPRDAQEDDWKPVKNFAGLPNGYPFALWPNILSFDNPATTRAVRLRLTGSTTEGHPHLKGHTKNGNRVWLGELLALQPLATNDLSTALLPASTPESGDHPPIPIRFTLKEPGYVTLVVEDENGKRIRNLVSETRFPAGDNVAWWDGTDDLGRDQDAARHGLYHIPAQPVAPGNYRVRGLVHKGFDLRYEFSVYNSGTPAWETEDKTGGWLTNHTPPQAALFLPENRAPAGRAQVLLGSAISEGGAGLAWVDLDGRKLGGRGWIGGNWTAAPYLARDDGQNPLPEIYAYVGATWTSSQNNQERSKGELRITGLTQKGDRPILKYPFTAPPQKSHDGDDHWVGQLKGLAIRDGLIVASMERLNALLIADGRTSEALGHIPINSPRGVAFDAQGRLLLLTEDKLLRTTLPADLTPYLVRDANRGQALDRSSWRVTSNKNEKRTGMAIDGNTGTRWDTGGPMRPGDHLLIDLGASRSFFKITLTARASDDFPREYEVYISQDGQTWGNAVAKGKGASGKTNVIFPSVTARFIKIVQTGKAENYWACDELIVEEKSDPTTTTEVRPLPMEALVAGGLQDPHGITLDSEGNIYVSERGTSHQVKVYSPKGHFLRAIGVPGAPKPGPYDPKHMNNPHGLAIDGRNQLWVTENDFQPKRVSVWSTDGKLLRDFYGPGRYGGGGTLDPRDKNRFYYDGVEFRLNWETGSNSPVSIFHRLESDNAAATSFSSAAPETPIYIGDRQYMTNCYNANPTGGPRNASIWLLKNGVAAPVASLGMANDVPLLKKDEFKSLWPKDVDPQGERWRNATRFLWSDLNDDGRLQPDEIVMVKGRASGITVQSDLAIVVARLDQDAVCFRPQRFTPGGAPVYDFSKAEILAGSVQDPASSGGDQVLISTNGWTVMTTAPKPFAREGFAGIKDGTPIWQYPSVWPGLHASHEAPVPEQPGQVIGTTRLLGNFITPKQGDAGPIWTINGNMGTMYMFTADGLFVSQLFNDSRRGKAWSMPKTERGMLLNELTVHDENFWPSITQTADGNVYLVDGARTSLVRIDGLDNIHRLPELSIKVTNDDLAKAQVWRVQAETKRQQSRGTGTLTVGLRNTSPVVDGSDSDWSNADWAVIDRRGVAAHFNSDSKPYDVTGAVSIAGDRLYAVWRTQETDLLKNSGETPQAPFKTGGCLDLMIAANPGADSKRTKPAAGDQRLLITKVNEKTLAVLYRGVVPGTADPVPFSSPWRTITIDRVEDVSSEVQLASASEKDEKGKVKSAIYEISVPLSLLGLKPSDNQSIKGDIGILRGQNNRTLQRVYWNNKATAITADVPSEAELTPALWGKWLFKKE